ncbi:MAG: hypothetical protein O9314_02625 [Microcystis sp. LE19-4.1E]|nr:hypothetical protein [Microcystis sp. LE19-4.1E]
MRRWTPVQTPQSLQEDVVAVMANMRITTMGQGITGTMQPVGQVWTRTRFAEWMSIRQRPNTI